MKRHIKYQPINLFTDVTFFGCQRRFDGYDLSIDRHKLYRLSENKYVHTS